MKKYYILPECGKWTETEATDAESAYLTMCCWHPAGTCIAVIDAATGQAAIFSRTLDAAGNLQNVKDHLEMEAAT